LAKAAIAASRVAVWPEGAACPRAFKKKHVLASFYHRHFLCSNPPVFAPHGRSRRSGGRHLDLACVRQALTTEAIPECLRSGNIWEAESNVEWLDLVSTAAAADWDLSLTVERINF
jgi:hypothetical protein